MLTANTRRECEGKLSCPFILTMATKYIYKLIIYHTILIIIIIPTTTTMKYISMLINNYIVILIITTHWYKAITKLHKKTVHTR